jgi:hypothetical protein
LAPVDPLSLDDEHAIGMQRRVFLSFLTGSWHFSLLSVIVPTNPVVRLQVRSKSVFGVDGEIGTSTLKLWLAIGSVGFFLGVYLLANLPPRYVISRTLRAAFLIVGVGLGAITGWACLDYVAPGEPRFERRSLKSLTEDAKMLLDYTPFRRPSAERWLLEARAGQLYAQAIAPGSPLACLDTLAGEAVETACEKELFASPANVAAAISFVANRLELLADMVAYEKRSGAEIGGLLRPLRGSLEADRFGFLAHVLSLRDGCTSESCEALALLDYSGRVRTNLSTGTFDHHIDYYAGIWIKPPNGSHEAPDGAVVGALQPTGPPSHRIANIDFPTADSIPAVSIMTSEPTGPVSARASTGQTPQQASATAARRTRKPAANSSSMQTLGQPPAANAGITEPIWPEPVPPQPPATAAAANGSAQLPNGNSTAPIH